jgi:predicted nucleotidyltransferase
MKNLSRIKKRLREFGAKFSEDIEGIYIYGSALVKENFNDVDVLVITKDGADMVKVTKEAEKIEKWSKKESDTMVHIQSPKPLSFWWRLVLKGEPWVVSSLENPFIIKDKQGIIKETIYLIEREIIYGKEEKSDKLLQRSDEYLMKNRNLLLGSIESLSEAATEPLQILLIFDNKVILNKKKIAEEIEKNYIKIVEKEMLDTYKEIIDLEEKMEKGALTEFTVENLEHYQEKIKRLIVKVEKLLENK